MTALERAFELAKSGSCESVAEIRTRLKEEGFSLNQITGKSLSQQLRGLIQAARATPPTPDTPPS